MIARVRRFLRLSGPERRLFLTALAGLPVMSVLLRCLGYSRVNGLVDLSTGKSEAPTEWIPVANRMVEAASRHGFRRNTCLEKSMLLRWLLLRHGIESSVQLGVRKEAEFEAHAWLEVRGIPINDDARVQEQYTALAVLRHPRC